MMGKKTVKSKSVKHDGKKPKSNKLLDSYDSKRPVWSFRLAKDNPEKWSIYCNQFSQNGLRKLAEFEGMTWAEIKRQTHDKGKSSNHFIDLESLCDEAKRLLDPAKYSTDQLFSIRVDNLTRIYGFLEQGIFYVFWYDQNHEVVLTKREKGNR